jgi:hypothetical protein
LEEQAELYAFRQRVAQRRIEEEAIFKTWKKTQKQQSTFPMKEISESEKRPIVMADNGDVIVSTSVDRSLLSQDNEHTRPDLAPFSTMINSMIYKYIRPVPEKIEDLVETNKGYEFNDKQIFVHVSTLSPRPPPSAGAAASEAQTQFIEMFDEFNAANSYVVSGPATADRPDKDINKTGVSSGKNSASTKTRGAGSGGGTFGGRVANIRNTDNASSKNNSGTSVKVSGSYTSGNTMKNVLFNTPIPNNAVIIQPPEPASSNPYFTTNFNRETGQISRSFNINSSESNKRGMEMTTHSTAAPYRDLTLISKYQVEIPMWEQMARLDNVPPVKTVQAEKKNKSAAYKALEKLCGLTEEDIKMQKRTNFGASAADKRPSDHMPLYNTNLLSLFK